MRSFFILPVWSLLGLLFGGFILWLLARFKLMKIIGLGLVMAVLGIGYFELQLPGKSTLDIAWYNGQTVEFTGVVASEVEARNNKQRITVSTSQMEDDRGEKEIRGKVLISAALYPEFVYGDELKVKCRLETPQPIEDFAYDKYLALARVYSVCYQPKITILSSGHGNFILSGIYSIKQRFLSKLNQMIIEPQASFLAGLLVGARSGMPVSLTEAFQRTGVSHIVAISGYNITIIASLILSLTQGLIGRKRAFWLVLAALGFFAIITGAQASVLRATIMGVLVLVAKQVGRLSNIGNALVLAAWLMVMFNPLVLAFDIGFQLSFLSTLGLVYLAPRTEKLFGWLPNALNLRESLVSTLSAIIFTLPMILFQFGRLSLVAPLVNILILPLIPIIMAVGFIAVTIGIVWLPIGQIIGWAVWLLLGYIIAVVDFFSKLNFSSIEIKELSVIFLVIGYLLIYSLIKNPLSFFRRQRKSEKNLVN
ncbi:MAG: ComEC/Rec2 family competence protein [Patescibacteria group bacterium]|nr:ComEC/Rec2 family competence protein [Patescibacteria group bacterium]